MNGADRLGTRRPRLSNLKRVFHRSRQRENHFILTMKSADAKPHRHIPLLMARH